MHMHTINEILIPYVFVILCGLSFGSFINVVIHRLPLMILDEDSTPHEQKFNLLTPSSHCPICRTAIRFYHNIPLFGFIALNGKCATCNHSISLYYPIIEAICGAAAAIIFYKTHDPMKFTAYSFFFLVMLSIIVIDMKHYIIPDVLSMPLLWSGLLLSTIHFTVDAREAIFSVCACWIGLKIVQSVSDWIAGRKALGEGDIKLFSAIGAWLGIQGALQSLLIGSAVGSCAGISLIIMKRARRTEAMPFGPYLGLGSLLTLYFT